MPSTINLKIILFFILGLTISSCSKNYGLKETENYINGYEKPSAITHTAVSFLDPASGLLLHGLNFYIQMNYKLNDLEKQLHIQALQYSLNYSKNGEITKWYNSKRDSAGRIKVLYSFYFNNKYCRTYVSSIILNNAKSRNKNTLCKMKNESLWKQI